ncbi:hypothetical protein, partial [Pseudomonas brassicacearum]|uniref:hypothetical protein n=1 Tax=Pseudomonas brassicacearum TaxID=930166 RepID=UPI0038621D79
RRGNDRRADQGAGYCTGDHRGKPEAVGYFVTQTCCCLCIHCVPLPGFFSGTHCRQLETIDARVLPGIGDVEIGFLNAVGGHSNRFP